ncbi:galanin receptor type 1-like [Actinia tenebrosa]|uniref:Galanin receptor type 1-like n=1 Tax=Actinia tenebrosa TaxID=6105 RepID=A0A6P8IX72_ACTTE|nr:galanin receptor type 1-like [Actinia tenebrosa]
MNGTTEQPNALQIISVAQLVFYIMVFVVGGVGNGLVLLIIKTKKPTRKTNDIFILNLALGDILVLFVSIPVDLYNKVYSMSSGILHCKFLWPLMTSGLFTSVFTLTCMAIERSRVICRPTASKLEGRRLLAVIIMIWVAAVLCVLPLVIVAAPDPMSDSCQEKWPSDNMRKVYTALLVALQYILPLTIISIAYSMISYRLKVSKRFRISNMANISSSHLQRHCIENSKINKNLRTIVILFAIFMLPKHIAWLWLDFGQGDRYQHFGQVLIFAEVFLYIHSSCNPLVYGTIMKDYRAGFKQYFKKLFTICCHCSLNKTSPAEDKATRRRQDTIPHLSPQSHLQMSIAEGQDFRQQDTIPHLSPQSHLQMSIAEGQDFGQQDTFPHLSPQSQETVDI